MLTRFFSQSKPIQSLFIWVFLIISYIIFSVKQENSITLLKLIASGVLILFCAMLVQFIVKKNKFQEQHSYSVLVFCLLLTINFKVYESYINILGLVFFLLALRRLLSLKSQIDVQKKLFDAGFWAFWAFLCDSTHILIIPLSLASALFYAESEIRNYILSILGFCCALIIHLAASLLLYKAAPRYFEYWPDLSLEFSTHFNTYTIINYGVTLMLGLIIALLIVKIYNPLKINQQRNLSLLLLTVILYGCMAIINLNFSINHLIIVSLSLSFLMGNVIQLKTLKTMYKEIMLWSLIALSLIQLYNY